MMADERGTSCLVLAAVMPRSVPIVAGTQPRFACTCAGRPSGGSSALAGGAALSQQAAGKRFGTSCGLLPAVRLYRTSALTLSAPRTLHTRAERSQGAVPWPTLARAPSGPRLCLSRGRPYRHCGALGQRRNREVVR